MTWYKKYLKAYNSPPDSLSEQEIDAVAKRLKALQSDTPVVTVSIIAYNEENNLWACLWALSDMACKYPLEIIGVNNNSKDRTEEIFQKSGIPYFNESRNSCGYARQCGLQNAKGKYHINIDADTMYPPHYVESMVAVLSKPGIVGVSATWGYIPDEEHSSLSLKCYEWTRNAYLSMQAIQRPEMSVRGLVFGYNTELALKVGIRVHIIRGEDGALASGLKKYGKIAFLRTKDVRAITGYGTVSTDGCFFNSFKVRAMKAVKKIPDLFTKKDEYIDEESNLIENKK